MFQSPLVKVAVRPVEGPKPGLCVADSWAEAKLERDKVAGRYDEAIGFTFPGRAGINSGPEASQVYDDTAVIAAPEFASNIQAGIMPNFAKWASHMAGVLIEDEEDKAELRTLLEPVDNYIFDMINSSNAASEIHEALLDLSIGTGLLRVDKGAGLHPLNTRAVPMRAFSFTVGADGQPCKVFEERWLHLHEIEADYPGIRHPLDLVEMVVPEAKPRKIRLVEAWCKDEADRRGSRWNMSVFYPDKNNHVGLEDSASGAGACPYVGPFRWSKGSGEAWGRGPVFNVLPSLRTVNYAMMALIDHADMALMGIWSIEDDGVVNTDTVTLEPGALIPKAPGSKGLENLRPGQDFNIQQFMLEEHRKHIKRALYTDELGDPDKSPKTATEVQQRMANLSRRIGSPFGRLVLELVLPFIRRVVYVLKEQGLIKLPVVDGKEITLIPTSPLAQSQRYDDIDAVERYSALIINSFGREVLNLVLDQNATATYLADRFPIPAKLLRPKEKQTEAMGMMQGMMGGGGQPAGPGEPAPV